MRIGINGLLLTAPPGTGRSGIHQYLTNLIAALPNALEPTDELVVYGARGQSTRTGGGLRAVSLTKAPTRYERVIVEHLALPVAGRRDRLDVFHGPAFALPRGMAGPTIATFHDLAFLRWPAQVTSQRHAYLSRAVQYSTATATRLIAVSEATKADMVDLLGADPAKIDVTPLGVTPPTPKQLSDQAIGDLLTELSIRRPFVLAVGNLEPRKNLESLVEAFAQIAADIPHDLVLAGATGWKADPLLALLNDPLLTDRVHLPGYLAPDRLPTLYAAAELFVIPSWYEGFGLTMLEAMACGTPVIASNRGSLPEMAGEAATLVDPQPETLADAIQNILADQDLRTRLTSAGLKRARRFTWQETARLTVQSYRKARPE